MFSGDQIFFILTGIFIAALVFSLLVNSVFMRFFHTFGIRENAPKVVRWNASSKPAFGGISFLIVFLFGFALDSALFEQGSSAFRSELLGLLVAAGLGFLMGLADDAYDTKPLLKVATQLACGLILVLSGTCIHLFGIPALDGALTVVWVVGLMNAINMLDNMDAIAALVCLCILVSALAQFLILRAAPDVNTILMISVCGALCGFLFFNWHPSRMYMGDTGSQFLGVFIAYLGIRYFWNNASYSGAFQPWRQVSITLVIFLLPIVDTTTVTINRILRGSSPFVGGKDHTTHHLGYAGLTDPQVAMAFGGLGLFSGFLGLVALRFIPVWGPLYTALYLGYALVVFLLLFTITRKRGIQRPM
ncbi:MAG: MraY family glycosyltransferase [Flavobacteriales bacterium]